MNFNDALSSGYTFVLLFLIAMILLAMPTFIADRLAERMKGSEMKSAK